MGVSAVAWALSQLELSQTISNAVHIAYKLYNILRASALLKLFP